MSCAHCYDLSDVVVNDPSFRIGSITNTNTAVVVYIENVGTGRIEVQAVTTDGSGNVDVDLTETYLDVGQSYQVYVSEEYYGQAYKSITPPSGGTVTYTCMTFTAKKAC